MMYGVPRGAQPTTLLSSHVGATSDPTPLVIFQLELNPPERDVDIAVKASLRPLQLTYDFVSLFVNSYLGFIVRMIFGMKDSWYTVFPRSVAAATINFSFTEVRRLRGRCLFEGGVYYARRTSTVSRYAPSAHVNFVLGLSRSHLRARWLTLSSSLPSSPFQRFVAIMSAWRHICACALQLFI